MFAVTKKMKLNFPKEMVCAKSAATKKKTQQYKKQLEDELECLRIKWNFPNNLVLRKTACGGVSGTDKY